MTFLITYLALFFDIDIDIDNLWDPEKSRKNLPDSYWK